MSRSIGKSGLSETYRSAYIRFYNYYNKEHVMRLTVEYALNNRSTSTVLRNGKRIIKACESVRKDIEAERETQVTA